MATLEKIRSKSVLLLIIIGVALLAFIIGDFLNSSRMLFGHDDNTVAKVGDMKIDAIDFQNRNSAANGDRGETNEGRAAAEQMLLRQMIFERLQDGEYGKLGLTVTTEEVDDAIMGANSLIGDMLVQQFTQGQFSKAADFSDFCEHPDKYGSQMSSQESRGLWLQYEEMVKKQLKDMKFFNMLAGTMPANNLDVEQMYKDANTGYMIAYVKKTFTPDLNVKVTDEEVKALWESEKEKYSLDEETRLVGMITLPIVPSPEDEEAARKEVDDVLAGLNSTEGLKALQDKKGFNSQRTTMTLSMLSEMVKRGGNSKMKDFAESAEVNSAVILDEDNGFQIAKLLGRDNQVDSLKINIVMLAAGDDALLDSVKTAMAEGKSAAELRAIGQVDALDSISVSLINPMLGIAQIESDLTAYKESFINADLGMPFMPDSTSTADFIRLYSVVERNAPEATVDIALIEYPLHPSKATVDGLRARLERYVAENSTADKFAANAAAANLDCGFYDVTPSVPYALDQFSRRPIDGSNDAAVWALQSGKGSVSPVLGDERTGVFVVACVKNVFNDYLTLDDHRVKEALTAKVRNSKIGDTMVKQYEGKAKDVAGYANVMESDVTSDNVALNPQSLRNYGPELVAKIITTPAGKFVGPTKGEDGVFVYQVAEISNPTRPVDMKSDSELFNMRRGIGAFQNNPDAMFRLFLGNRKVDNRYHKVFKNN